MRKIIVILAFICLLIVLGCKTTGNESSIGTKDEDVKKAQPVKPKVAVKKMLYTAFLVKDISYFNDGIVENYKVVTYDDGMSVIREDYFDSFDKLIESIVYEKLQGNEKKRTVFNSRGEVQSWKKIIIDPQNNLLLSEEVYSNTDKLKNISEYEYDNQGNKISWIVKDGNQEILSIVDYFYEDGNNTKIDLKDATGEIQEYFILDYKDNLLVKEAHYDANGSLKDLVEYSYTDGYLTERKTFRSNKTISGVVRYINNENGDCIKREMYDSGDNLKSWIESEYEYAEKETTVWE